jgi:ribulose-phosphate 3-epimerase
MTEIIASILSPNYSYEQMKNKISLLKGHIPTIQIDLCDGRFTPSVTWPFNSGGFEDFHFDRILNEAEGLPFWEEVDFELDLMLLNAVEDFDKYLKLGPKGIIFHVEAQPDIEEFKNFLEGIDVYVRDVTQIGIAFKPGTPLETIYPLVNTVDFVQIMGNDKIGAAGVTLDEKVYGIIKTLREKYSDLPIEVDIGITMETAPKLVEAGATKLVAGSAIFNSGDIIGAIEYFQSL